MATLTGVASSVTIPGGMSLPANLHTFEWTANIQRTIFDDSNFDDATNAITQVGGMYKLVGSFQATVDQADAASIGDLNTEHGVGTDTFVLTLISTKKYTFTAIVTSINVVARKNDRVFMTVNFESSGDIAAV